MDSNKFYCRNAAQSNESSSSISSATSSTTGCGSSSIPEHVGCSSAQSTSGYACKDVLSKNANCKTLPGQRATNTSTALETGGSGTSGYCSSNSSGNGNYINVMPASMGSLQYQRKKPTPQDLQSRLYYNTTDYRCREDFYAMPGGTRGNTSSPSPSLQLQSQQQLAQHHQQSHQHQQQHHTHQIHTHHHQATCGSNTINDFVEEGSCNSGSENNGRVVAATQTHHSGNAICEPLAVPTSISLGSASGPPMMYTVHRVVTTAQIQTASGNTFASSSSISSVVSAVRNEGECMSASTTVPLVDSNCSVSSGGGLLGDGNSNVINNNTADGHGAVPSLHGSPCPSTNINYLQSQQKCNNTSEVQNIVSKITNSNYTSSVPTSNTGYLSGAKSSSSIPRHLQNVIPTCVYLMSRVAVHMEIEGTAQCPTQVMLAAALGCEELGISNKLLAQSIFGLWMTSALLEIQLKSHHRPYVVRVAWHSLLEKFSHGNPIEKKFDEPMIMLKRNVFFSKRDEEKIKDHRILELLYEEAKYNVLSGRYVMESVHSLMLGGIQARIELGPYNSHTHTISFFRENQSRFLPHHVAKSSSWSWLPVSRKNSAEVKLLEQYKRVPQTATTRKLMRKYLEFCWALPFYGAAFFHGQVEQPVHGIMSFVHHKDVEVIIAVNERGIFILDPIECTLLLGLRYEDLSWDFAKPSATDDPECQTCIFVQFDAVENGIQISKLMQIFSKQAAMIDALIAHFTEQMRKRKQDNASSEPFHDEPNPIQNNGNGVLCNKLSRLTLATFDEENRCIGQMGSLSISY